MDLALLEKWIGRTETRQGVITPVPILALAATLDREPPETDLLPPLWHWLYFLPIHKQSELGADGHAERGGFLPPVPLPRRMWAGGRLQFHGPLRVGESVTRISRVAHVRRKQGRSGELVFVLVEHKISTAQGLSLTEEHDIVFRGHPRADDPAPVTLAAPTGAEWSRTIHPNDVLLFRYSALTFNGHRIHYDRRYAMETEGYPGLVVHGPLIATFLLDLLHRFLPTAQVNRFEFRALSPLFDTAPFTVCGKQESDQVKLWAQNMAGGLAMEANAILT